MDVSTMKWPRSCRTRPSPAWTRASSGFQVSLRTGMPRQVRWCPRGCCAWLVPLHSLTPPVWCASAVPITRLPVRMFCDAPCHVQSLLVCHVGCALVHGLVTCRGRCRGRCWNSWRYVPSSSFHLLGTLRSRAVLRLSDQACISVRSTPIQKHFSVRGCVVTCCTDVGACDNSVGAAGWGSLAS